MVFAEVLCTSSVSEEDGAEDGASGHAFGNIASSKHRDGCIHAFKGDARNNRRSRPMHSNRLGNAEACVVSSSEDSLVSTNLTYRKLEQQHKVNYEEKERSGKKIRNKGKKNKKEKKLEKRRRVKKRKKKDRKHKKRRKGSSSSSTSSSLSPASEITDALAYGKIFLAKYLINKHGVHLYNSNGEGPLHCAARHNESTFVSWLLAQSGAAGELDMQNNRGETALLVATKLLHGSCALRLIEALADPGIVDQEGLAPEALDLDSLLQEAERADSLSRNAHNAETLRRSAPAPQMQDNLQHSHEDIEWGQRLFSEMMEDEFRIHHEVFAGYEDLERQDEVDDDSWMDDIARQYQERKQKEARAHVQERLRVVMQAREDARQQADAQEARARLEAQRRAASDAEFQRHWRESQYQKEPRPQVRGDRGNKHKTCIATRVDDDARWRTFEERIQKLNTMESPSASHVIQYKDIPWPSGPPGNPLHIDPSGHPAVLRSQIRAGLLRWHPDKFDQRVGRFLPTEGVEKEKALSRVKELAQQLNRLMTELVANTSETAERPSSV